MTPPTNASAAARNPPRPKSSSLTAPEQSNGQEHDSSDWLGPALDHFMSEAAPAQRNNNSASSNRDHQSLLETLGLAPTPTLAPAPAPTSAPPSASTSDTAATAQLGMFPGTSTQPISATNAPINATDGSNNRSAPPMSTTALSNLLLSDFSFAPTPSPFPLALPLPNHMINSAPSANSGSAWSGQPQHMQPGPTPSSWGPPPALQSYQSNPFLPPQGQPMQPFHGHLQPNPYQPPMIHSIPMYQYPLPPPPTYQGGSYPSQQTLSIPMPMPPLPSYQAHRSSHSQPEPLPLPPLSSARSGPASLDFMQYLDMTPPGSSAAATGSSSTPFDFPLFHTTPSLAPPSGPVPHLFSPDHSTPLDAPPRIEERVSTESAQCPDTNRIVTRTTTTRTSASGSTTMTTTTTVYSMSSPPQAPMSPGLVEDLLPPSLLNRSHGAEEHQTSNGAVSARRKRSASLDGGIYDHHRPTSSASSRSGDTLPRRRPTKRARANSSSVVPGTAPLSPLFLPADSARSTARAPTAPPSSRPASDHRHTRASSHDPTAHAHDADDDGGGDPGSATSPDSVTRCLWFTCSATFSDAAQLVPHLSTAHTPANHNKSNTCKWGGAACGEMGNTRFASTDELVSHLLGTHIRAIFDEGGHQCDQQGGEGEHAHDHGHEEGDGEAHGHGHGQHQHAQTGAPHSPTDAASAAGTNPADQAQQPTHDLHVCLWTECGLHFGSFSDLTVHVSQDHVGAKQSSYVCRWRGCDRGGRPFAQRQKVMRHLQMHTGWKPYECTTCAQRFSEHTVLVSHMRTHSGEKPFTCDFADCSKSFSIAGALTVHKRTHTGERPFVCKHQGCDKRFNESSNLTKHMRTHTLDRPFRCPVCERSFARSDQAKRHLETVHVVAAAAAAVGGDGAEEGEGVGEADAQGQGQGEEEDDADEEEVGEASGASA